MACIPDHLALFRERLEAVALVWVALVRIQFRFRRWRSVNMLLLLMLLRAAAMWLQATASHVLG